MVRACSLVGQYWPGFFTLLNGIANSNEIQSDENTMSIKYSNLNAEAESNVYTHILNKMDDIDSCTST